MEINSDLPQGWSSIALNQITTKLIDGSHNPPSKQEHGLPMLSARNIENGKINFNDFRYIDEIAFETENNRTKVRPGDVLLTIVGAIGRATTVPENIEPFTLQRSVAVLSPIGITPEFLMYQLRSPRKQAELLDKAKGTAQKGIYLKKLGGIELLVPPLNEQRRIVAKIEALKARSQRVKEELETIAPLLDQFRQSVLAAAFRGDLTADWREKNPDVEPASVLLERIRAERDRRYEQECQKSEAEGRKKTTPFKQNIEPIDLSSLPAIPDTWSWERIVNISNVIGGVTKGRQFGNRKTIMLPYLRVANVQDGFLDLNEIKEIEVLPEDLQKYHLEYGDILFTEGGDRDKLGRGTVWLNNLENCIHQNHIYRARLYYPGVSSSYISIATKSKYAKAYFFANANQTTNLASINITTLGNLPLPIPPKKEQEKIVYRVNKFFKVADLIEQQYKEAQVYLDQLDRSILAKAFRGELVPQDPNDEPASVLLERIRAEREKLDTKKKAKGKTEKKSHKAKPEPAEPKQLSLPGFE
ncbi:restriction endonuclease subunit S [Microcoleus sp. D3_18a_C4]|uniref:restriction endonuclease subunit S n=1 Tax=Microcoleus sp. D3_18a_C4 TaxID=3055332 RepID=UPI002FD3A4C6